MTEKLLQLQKLLSEIIDEHNNDKILKDCWFVYDKETDGVFQFADKKDVVIYGDIQEAMDDISGDEKVVNGMMLPDHWKKIVLTQLKRY